MTRLPLGPNSAKPQAVGQENGAIMVEAKIVADLMTTSVDKLNSCGG